MKFEFTENHLYIKTGGLKIRLTLDNAERLRAFIEKYLYRKDRELKKIKEIG